MDEIPRASKTALPLILIAAVVQGWALFGLHHALRDHHWPATHYEWLFALYALVVFVPLTLQLMADYRRMPALWLCVAILAVAFFYFGWHHGTHVVAKSDGPYHLRVDYYEGLTFVFAVLWMHLMPFIQCRLLTGIWSPQYPALFAQAWRNFLMLAEAALFTGLLWLLLFLLAMLFHMLGIDFFKDLFQEPIFVYPVTSLAFGFAIHLIGSVDKLTSVALEQILNLLKWLAVLAGLILAMFGVALMLNLPRLVFTGEKAIGAEWLLWLVAGMVLLLNAAYRDGSDPRPYPRWIALLLRIVAPLLVLISATAIYALCVRAQHFGLTVSRVWAFVVAGAAFLYSLGYAAAAFDKSAWFGGIARVNIAVAVALIIVITATLTPLLSPFRLAADSQFRLILARGTAAEEREAAGPGNAYRYGDSPLRYLRFRAGEYGLTRLKELSQDRAGKDADKVRTAANAMLQTDEPYKRGMPQDARAAVAALAVFPAGSTLDAALIDAIAADMQRPARDFAVRNLAENGAGIFIDLKGDGANQFVLLVGQTGFLYEKQRDRWLLVGSLVELPNAPQGDFSTVTKHLRGSLQQGEVAANPPAWKDLKIGAYEYRVLPEP
jgi:hypothetical protein